ncbi:MAG: LLM class flavin-dependent oxidoreductase, partial [Gammaproteobacteria bacterium]|nr:LLM class flavin-dependent oxidoreductase [Gammaproteobacteria bacterium]
MMHDPFICLAVAAAVTGKAELGMAILQLPLYNATDVAMKAFSLAQVSGNRLLLGVGAGSTEADYQIHGEDFQNRFRTFNERLSQLREAFAEGTAKGGDLNPWPGVAAGPPLLFGTWGGNVATAATEFDGWIASGMHRSPDECAAALEVYRNSGGGRAVVSTIRIFAETDLGEMKDILLGYADAGFDDAVVMCQPGVSIDDVRALIS